MYGKIKDDKFIIIKKGQRLNNTFIGLNISDESLLQLGIYPVVETTSDIIFYKKIPNYELNLVKNIIKISYTPGELLLKNQLQDSIVNELSKTYKVFNIHKEMRTLKTKDEFITYYNNKVQQ